MIHKITYLRWHTLRATPCVRVDSGLTALRRRSRFLRRVKDRNSFHHLHSLTVLNRLTTNDPYMSHTAPLTSKRCILYIYSTNIGTEYFKHAFYPPFISLQNAVCFIMLTCLVPVLFTFYIQDVLKLKKK